ncbi:MAG: bifunctional methylenetetrahydrofolate dehydrogenase/methenyltetrahydrofolate cyclohydrolase FolD [Clostridia bacterium]|nr:bifunctional methylenetetrahydrofolate dehydrogenase/methenyltetrahydrofolate cyclohydrolase FolD [Clostridia bacterium]
MAILMDGKALAAETRKDISRRVAELDYQPSLAVIIVGNNPASRFYVNNKKKDCAECGIKSIEYALSEDTKESELLELIARLNADDELDGILVQLPLPKGIDEKAVIAAISPQKDVDAFHAENVGHIMLGDAALLPCTPAGVMRLLERYGIDPAGKECVVIGRSNIVGKPQAMLLLHRNATVTICHSRTRDLPEVTRRADIIVCAVGKVDFLRADMVRRGAVVIDVGMNTRADGSLTGDVDFAAVEPIASYITPAPGGVGPMTRVMLLENTLTAAKMRRKS